jgi:predicted transcriptional regulator
MTRSRVSITIPEELVEAADRLAADLDCSRSRLVSEALRSYLAASSGPRATLREAGVPYAAGAAPSRVAQLEADLALSPEERVRLAEQTALVAELRGSAPQRDRVIGFDRIADFLAWERHEDLRP